MKKFIFALFASTALILTGCATPAAGPTDLSGDWAYSSDTFNFDATVEGEEIEINLVLEDGSKGLYWVGTFPNEAEDGDAFTSNADVEKLESSLFGSQDTTKDFLYKDGKLVYEFTIMGMTSDVELAKK